MANKNGNAYGLTLLCPIKNGSVNNHSFRSLTREFLQNMPLGQHSPMAKVPNTYLCRFYVLDDVLFEGGPDKQTFLQNLLTGTRSLVREEHLKSAYLVFSSNFHGERDDYLTQMWHCATDDIQKIWQHCVAFDQVNNAQKFIDYIRKCQVDNQLFFNGSNDDPLAEQLKALYVKQEFSRFVFNNQAYRANTEESAVALKKAFTEFLERVQPADIRGPTWVAGAEQELVDLGQ